MSKLPQLLGRLPERYQWTLHNLVAHPISEVVHLAGYTELGNRLHDMTIPQHEPGTGRG
jgi:hypothetical protein